MSSASDKGHRLSQLMNIPRRFRREVSSGAYRPEIDGLRFLAIAIVVFGHFFQRAVRFFPSFRDVADGSVAGSAFYLGPGLGVFLFFAVSGFIIASQARRARSSPLSGGFLKAYFGRRILRIEPPYFVLLVVSWLILVLSGYQPEGTRQFFTEPQSLNVSLAGSLFYAHDLIWGTFPRLFPPGWTLEVEVQFYVTAPLLFWLWFRLDVMRWRLALAAALWLAANVLSTWLPQRLGPLFISYSILRYFGFFWLGIVLADLRDWWCAKSAPLSPVAMTLVGWAGLTGFLCLPEFPDSALAGLALRIAAGATIVAMFASALAENSGFRRFCARPWISLVGGACYSIYLTHMQLIQAMSVFAAKHFPGLPFAGVLVLMIVEIVVVVAAGMAFYVAVERPFMTRDWPRRVLAGLRGATGMFPIAHEKSPADTH